MTIAEHYNSLSVHPDVSILGVRVLPLSVGHAKLLPALGLDDPQSIEELLAAALICASRPEAVVGRLRSKAWRFCVAVRAFVSGFIIRLMSGRSKVAHHVVAIAALKQWRAYVDHYKAAPQSVPCRSGAGSTRDIYTPVLAHVESGLIEAGFTSEQVDSMPLNEALWRHSVAREASGDVTLLDEMEMTDDEYMAAQRFADMNQERWIAVAMEAAK